MTDPRETDTGTDDPVLVERDGPILTLRLNRPHRLNAVSQGLYDRLVAELTRLDGDASVRCVLLTGSGRAFCAGADLKAHSEREQTPEERDRYTAAAQEANRLLQQIDKPVVAAVRGAAVGAGLELALSADFAIVGEDAKLRLPEVALGTFIGGGAAYTLAERVGVLRARELVYFGELFSGAEAAEMGVVSRAVPDDEVETVARDWAARLAERAPLPLAAAKRLLGPAGPAGRGAVLEREREELLRIFASRDWREGVEAFRDKRPPEYRGA